MEGEGEVVCHAEPDAFDDAFSSLAEIVPAAILTADLTGQVTYTNLELRRLLRGPVTALTGNGWRKVVHPEDVANVARMSAAALDGERGDLLFRIIDDDDLRWLRGHLAPMRIGGEIAGLVAVFDDVTTQRERESQLAHQATHDPLTGLPNRMLLRDRLSQALGRLARVSSPIAVLFIDLDGFKDVNDELGHRAGDEVLIEVARRMLTSIRPTDTVSRLGGDEFMIISEGQDEGDVTRLCDRLATALTAPMETSGGEVCTSAAIGALVVHGNATVDEVIHQADAAMYRAKRHGPASVEVHRLD
jgi:diguanylate cyclase (GGDEF)-like protein/PAS domain S-box-containing protein